MSVAGVKTARPRTKSGGAGGRSAPRSVVVARVVLDVPPPPPVPTHLAVAPVGDMRVLARRSDLHAARRLRRHAALVGLGVLATTLGATVAVLDVFH